MKKKSQLIILGNGSDWCEYSLNKLIKINNVSLFNKRLPLNNKYLLQIARLHYSYKIERYFKLPLKKIWYRKFCRDIGLNNKYSKQCLLIYDRNILGGDKNFLKYIRENFQQVKLAYIFTNIVKYTGAQERKYLNNLNDWYDLVFAFDPIDAEKYGFEYSPLIYDANEQYVHLNQNEDDQTVFYIGQAKDRLNEIILTFEKLKKLNVNTDFNIVKVLDNEQKYNDEIMYNNHLSYDEVLRRINKASCLVEIVQGDSTGLTLKTCEAVCYQKKLITNNKHIMECPFYDPKYIRVINSAADIDRDFFDQNTEVSYVHGNDFFSSTQFLNRLWSKLK